MARMRARAAIGVLIAAYVSLAARRARALSPSGVVAATAVGGAVFAGAGFRGGAALAAFFVSSTLLGRIPASQALEQHRGNERDAVQVFANGGLAATLALMSAFAPGPVDRLLMAGFGGAVATATADTWATEVGSRSGDHPRSVISLAPVSPGTSGGVTRAGLMASAAGAALIATVAAGAGLPPARSPSHALAIAVGGFIGALADSIFGATVQDMRFCDRCGQQTEMRVHGCGDRTRSLRGLPWCDNDAVNALATATGAATTMAIAALTRQQSSANALRPRWRGVLESLVRRGV